MNCSHVFDRIHFVCCLNFWLKSVESEEILKSCLLQSALYLVFDTKISFLLFLVFSFIKKIYLLLEKKNQQNHLNIYFCKLRHIFFSKYLIEKGVTLSVYLVVFHITHCYIFFTCYYTDVSIFYSTMFA